MRFSAETAGLLVLIGFGVGAFATLIGAGGGFILTYARQRRVDYRSGTLFALATLPGAIGGAIVVGSVSRQLFDGIMGAMLALLAL